MLCRTGNQMHILIAVTARAAPAGSAVGTELEGSLLWERRSIYAYQEHYFEALERLDTEIAQHYGVDEPELDPLRHHIDHAEFSVGDFELHYRMHHRAGRAIKAVLESRCPRPRAQRSRLSVWQSIHFQKDQAHGCPARPRRRFEGQVPEDIRDDVEFPPRQHLHGHWLGRPTPSMCSGDLQDSRERPERASRATTSELRCCRTAEQDGGHPRSWTGPGR